MCNYCRIFMWYFHLRTSPKDPEAFHDNKSKVKKMRLKFCRMSSLKVHKNCFEASLLCKSRKMLDKKHWEIYKCNLHWSYANCRGPLSRFCGWRSKFAKLTPHSVSCSTSKHFLFLIKITIYSNQLNFLINYIFL